jgi:hypothetical protein
MREAARFAPDHWLGMVDPAWTGDGEEGDPLPATAPDRAIRVIPAFTSPVHLHTAGRLAFELMGVRDLARRLPEGHVLYLNPSAAVSITVDTDMLLDALKRVPAGDVEDDAQPRPATIGGDLPAAEHD